MLALMFSYSNMFVVLIHTCLWSLFKHVCGPYSNMFVVLIQTCLWSLFKHVCGPYSNMFVVLIPTCLWSLFQHVCGPYSNMFVVLIQTCLWSLFILVSCSNMTHLIRHLSVFEYAPPPPTSYVHCFSPPKCSMYNFWTSRQANYQCNNPRNPISHGFTLFNHPRFSTCNND